MSDPEILDAIDAAAVWLDIEGVLSVAEGELGGKPCLEVRVLGARADLPQELPNEFQGYPVAVIENETPISAQDD